jgi:hypothetical protein
MAKKNLLLVMLAIALVFGMVACEEVDPDLVPEEEVKAFLGTYKDGGRPANNPTNWETVAFNSDGTQCTISDTTNDTIVFIIDKWYFAPTPTETELIPYPNGYKFTGKIKSASTGYIPNTTPDSTSATAPNFTQGDVKSDLTGPECWMYIYFATATSGTFVRTPFSSADHENGNIPVALNAKPTKGQLRIYTKQ